MQDGVKPIASKSDLEARLLNTKIILMKAKITSAEFQKKYGKSKASKKRAEKNKFLNSEEQDQTSLAKYLKLRYPKVLYTIDMGGVNIKSIAQAVKIHQQRCKRGHPDMMIQEWYKDLYCGLGIELKRSDIVINEKAISKSKHLQEQLEYINGLRERCWLAGFVSGYDNAKRVVDLYLLGDDTKIEEINKYIFPPIKLKP